MELQNCTATSENNLAVSYKEAYKVKYILPMWPIISSLDISLRKLNIYVHTKTYTWMFIATLFIIVKTGNDPNVHQQKNEAYLCHRMLLICTTTRAYLKTLCQLKEVIHKRLHSTWFPLYNILEKAKV